MGILRLAYLPGSGFLYLTYLASSGYLLSLPGLLCPVYLPISSLHAAAVREHHYAASQAGLTC